MTSIGRGDLGEVGGVAVAPCTCTSGRGAPGSSRRRSAAISDHASWVASPDGWAPCGSGRRPRSTRRRHRRRHAVARPDHHLPLPGRLDADEIHAPTLGDEQSESHVRHPVTRAGRSAPGAARATMSDMSPHHNAPEPWSATCCTPPPPGPSSASATTPTGRHTTCRSGCQRELGMHLVPVHPSAAEGARRRRATHARLTSPTARSSRSSTASSTAPTSATSSTRRSPSSDRLGIEALWLQLGVVDEEAAAARQGRRARRRHGHLPQDRVAPDPAR